MSDRSRDTGASPPASLSRRRFLKVGAMAAGAGACRSGAPDRPDHAGAAQKAYAQSLKALRRTTVTPAGAEIAESGTGLLSLSPDTLLAHRNARPGQPDFDVLIIGSGYGGAICAARLAARRKPGVKIGVLERGREWVPGTFPSSLANFRPFSRRSSWLRAQLKTNPLGLYGFHNQGDVTVVSGSGLGGSSLINCAVVIETEAEVLRQATWPQELRSKDTLAPYYARVQRMLAPPADPPGPLSAQAEGAPRHRRRPGPARHVAGRCRLSGVTCRRLHRPDQWAGHPSARLRGVWRLLDRL
jgi:cholesterol oxidase